MMQFDLTYLPSSDLVSLNTPKHLTLTEFEALPVPEADYRRRQQIYALEEHLFSRPEFMDDTEMEAGGMAPKHTFVNGLYHRELYIPPGQLVVGKRHAIEHIVMLTTGSCSVFTERGVEFLVAPFTFISPAGEKRVVMTHDEGCTWVTLHPTNKTDLRDIEDEVIIAEPARQAHYQRLHAEAKEKRMNYEPTEVLS